MSGINEDWEIGAIETPQSELKDEGIGKATIIRQFVVMIHPDLMKIESDVELLEYFKKETTVELWKQGLELISELRLVRNQHNKQQATIFAVCQVKQGEMLHPMFNPQTIQDAIKTS